MTAAQTRTRLLDTALELIWNSNYDSVGVNEICRQAGVTKGSFYHHFASKAALFCDANHHHWESIRHELDTLLSPSCPPLLQLANWIIYLWQNKIGDDPENLPGCAFFTAGSQATCGDAQVLTSMQEMSQRCALYNAALINNLGQGGFLDATLEPEQGARLLHHYIQGVLNHTRITRDLVNIKSDLPLGVFRVIGLKPENWQTVLNIINDCTQSKA